MDTRTPVVIVAGTANEVRHLGETLLEPGTVLIVHNLSLLGEGVVTRTLTTLDGEQLTLVELAHGCVSCTLRMDLLPLLRTLSDRTWVTRIVLLLDPALEPAEICEAIDHVVVTGQSGRVDAPAGHDVVVTAVLAAVDTTTWLADATGDDTLAEQLGGDDDRTVAQVAVARVHHADAVVLFGRPDPLEADVLAAVLQRLAPTAVRHWTTDGLDMSAILAALPERRADRGFDPHAPLLDGAPPLNVDTGVCLVEFTAQRPFHPERLHEAIDTLLDGVVTTRGRVWLATRPRHVLWLESAGGGLRIGPAGCWLAAMTPDEQEVEDPQRRALAAVNWHPRFGDRHSSLVVLVHRADPSEIERALRWALVTDHELRQPDSWQGFADPFGEWHDDPCGATESTPSSPTRDGEQLS
ncbi:ribosome hibernation factor-recruiting GTPase MRF [Nocardia sp. CNY236]|uniref:ribosome hibernation factor-recruiting GTPase MRF n=1 Tax=Nocardia sp. CNY236 TaxID=1169152 RepID=UPI0003F88B14|nr:GTP-binding protein [Nocardia sp. CNY236]